MSLFHRLPVEHKLQMLQLKQIFFINRKIYSINLLDASIYNGLYSAFRIGGIPSRLKYSLWSCKVNERNFLSLSKSGRSIFRRKKNEFMKKTNKNKYDVYIKNFFSSK